MAKILMSTRWRDQPLGSRLRLLMAWTVLPCLLLLVLYGKERWGAVQFGRDELSGTDYVQALLDLRLQAWAGSKAPAAERLRLKQVQARLGARLGATESWKALESAMDAPAGAGPGMPAPAREAWGRNLAAVSDGSSLILDPDLDTYYLMDAVCLSLAQQRELWDGLGDLLWAAQRRPLSPAEVFQSEADLEDLSRAAAGLKRNFKVIYAQSGDGAQEKARLQPALEAYTAAVSAASSHPGWLGAASRKRSQAELAKALAAHEELWRASLRSLEALLHARVGRLQRGMAGSLILTVLILALAGSFARAILNSVLLPVRSIGEEIALIEKGDLRQRSRFQSGDELGQLAEGVEVLRRRLIDVPQSLSLWTTRLATSLEELKRDHQVQASILVTQSSALAQTQVTSEEIRQTSRQAAAQAKFMIVEAAKARDMSQSGGEALEKSLDSLLAIRSRVELLAADVEALEGRARRIEGIIDSVKDLADQSNLLALNAAIEAMRAGAQGQGFGLVAREIRALADQSISATEQVRQVLGDLNDGVREAAKASREGVHDIQKGLERVQSSAESLTDIQVTVGESVGQLQRIAAVVQQQDAGLTQVFIALKDQGDKMAEAERQQAKTTAALEQLEKASEGLGSVIKDFKI